MLPFMCKTGIFLVFAIWCSMTLGIAAYGEQRRIKGKVLDSNDEPIVGVVVVVLNSPQPTKEEVSQIEPLMIEIDDTGIESTSFAVLQGTKLVVKNNSDIGHQFTNIMTGLNLVQPNTTQTFLMKEAGPTVLKCSIHPDEKLSVYVCENSSFALTNSEGCFELSNVPDGLASVKFWHPENGYVLSDILEKGCCVIPRSQDSITIKTIEKDTSDMPDREDVDQEKGTSRKGKKR
jgi:hypothetical protein